VQVLDVDLNRERISLGLKQTTEDPWKQLVKNFPIGSIIEGAVTKLVPFGVFVELGDGVEGLVHISEMAKGHVETPDQVATVGQKVHVKVMDVDEERRRISLSMRSAAETLGFEIEITGRPEGEGDDEVEGDEVVTEVVADEVVVDEAVAEDAVAEDAAVEVEVDEEVAAEVETAEVAEEVATEVETAEVVEEVAAEVETAEVVKDEAAE